MLLAFLLNVVVDLTALIGTMGNWVDCIENGEQAVDIKGPTGEIEYVGKGKFIIEGKERTFKNINLLAGGSGVTPDWQLIKAALSDKDDPTKIKLISGNSSKVRLVRPSVLPRPHA